MRQRSDWIRSQILEASHANAGLRSFLGPITSERLSGATKFLLSLLNLPLGPADLKAVGTGPLHENLGPDLFRNWRTL
jgi:hypothetical protein